MSRRRSTQEHLELLGKCARLFYEKGLTKTEIGHQLGFSGTHVRRLLDQAQQAGIVRIHIVEDHDFALLQDDLAAIFSLRTVRVAPSQTAYEAQKSELGKAAARLFTELVTHGSTVGIGGGGTLKSMVDYLPRQPRTIHVAPTALVGRGPKIEHVDAAYLVFRLHDKSAPKATASAVGMLPSPRDQRARATLEALVRAHIPEVEEVLAVARAADTVFVGLGGPSPVPELVPILDRTSPSTHANHLLQAAGGINYNYFDGLGRPIASLFKTIDISELQNMAAIPDKRVILVAGGSHKREALEIALRVNCVNGLVTDEQTARLLLAGARLQGKR